MEEFIFELLFDSSSSEEDEEAIANIRRKKPRIENYELVIDSYNDEEFREHFRMNKNTFNYILNIIEPNLTKHPHEAGRKFINAKKQLLIALWYFATPDSYRSISTKFNIGKATGLRIVRRITEELLLLASRFIKWPEGDYLQRVVNGFHHMGFPNTIGCIDGSYIKIPLPTEHGIAYICRKNFPAIILQGVCDNKLLFTHCYAGEVGSVHDARVLRNSEIWEYITTNQRDIKFPNDTHLLGDKAYPCLPQLLTPFRENGHLNERQRNYNFKLSAARQTIERAYCLLKLRWRCLRTVFDVRCMNWIPKYVIACCVLHNICILQDDVMAIDEFIPDENARQIHNDRAEAQMRQAGGQKRDQIANNLP